MLCIAVSWAEAIKATKIFIGAVQEDSSGYPDCRKDFFDAFQLMINQGTKPDTHIQIITPLLNMSKKKLFILVITLMLLCTLPGVVMVLKIKLVEYVIHVL